MNPTIPFMQMMFMDLTIRMVLVYIMTQEAKQQAIKDIIFMLNDGKLDNRISQIYTLEKSADAHNSIEKGGNLGSVIIKI